MSKCHGLIKHDFLVLLNGYQIRHQITTNVKLKIHNKTFSSTKGVRVFITIAMSTI